ncbi:MAG: NusA-like transcription termination signal-binding factor [Candidatus Aenigmarchaeota archaeon]|nr:NusA-like transcription termination signal-binding factor [Candidatus Aenigmarchaeota archaeon]
MMLKLDTDAIKIINFFEKYTKVHARDCIIEPANIIFIVEEGKAGKAIGKKGLTINELERKFNRKLKIFEWSDNLEKFVSNLAPQAKSAKLEEIKGKNILNISVDSNKRGLLIGKAGTNINRIKTILKRYYDIDEIKLQQ